MSSWFDVLGTPVAGDLTKVAARKGLEVRLVRPGHLLGYGEGTPFTEEEWKAGTQVLRGRAAKRHLKALVAQERNAWKEGAPADVVQGARFYANWATADASGFSDPNHMRRAASVGEGQREKFFQGTTRRAEHAAGKSSAQWYGGPASPAPPPTPVPTPAGGTGRVRGWALPAAVGVGALALGGYLLKRKRDKEKVAGADHWRRLPSTQTGHDEGGNETKGRTWVNNTKPGVTVKPHQQDALRAVAGMPQRGGLILAHGTGTGKTPSAVMAFEQMKAQGQAKRALVLTPAGLRTNFDEQGVRKFTTSRSQILQRPTMPKRNTDYAIVSYDAFRQRPEEYVREIKPDVIIADEFHRASNPNSKTYKAIAQVRPEVPKFLGLTASISQNDPSDLAPLLSLARGEPIDRKQFKRTFVKRVDAQSRGVFGGRLTRPEMRRQQELSKLVGDTIHYVEDLDAREKPQKIGETVEVPMSDAQLKLYNLSLKGVDPRIQRKIAFGIALNSEEQKGVFTRLMMARQASNSMHTMVPEMTPEASSEATPKVKRLLDDVQEHLENTDDGQVIVYTNFVRGGVDTVTAGLKKRGISFGVFAGKGVQGMTEEARQQAVKDYKSGKKKVIVLTGAGAEGLSLGNTTFEAVLDGSYNPERNSQAEARGIRAGGLAHRKPEDRKVLVRRYVSTVPRGFWRALTFRKAPTSVEQFVYGTAERKERGNRELRDILQRRSDYEQKNRQSLVHRLFAPEPS